MCNGSDAVRDMLAENARLRAALLAIARVPHRGDGDSTEAARKRAEIARQALGTLSTERCLGCGQPVGARHNPECEYAPYYSTARGYAPRIVNAMQARIPPLNTRD